MTEPVEIFTDGACRGNPGPGGWGVLLKWKDHEKSLSGGERQTTNNRMELLAAIRGLETLKQPCHVVVTTDSRYVLDGVTRWLANWKARQWKTASKQPVKNIDLWQRLDAALGRHRRVEWRWVRGHSGHPQNETADRLANQAIDALRDDDPQRKQLSDKG